MEKVTAYIKGGSDRKSLIYLRILLNGKYIYESLGIGCEKKDFDTKNQLVKSTKENARDYNLIINQKKAFVNDIFIKYRLANKELTSDIFKKEFRNPSTEIDFYEYMKDEMSKRKKDLAHGTFKNHTATFNVLKEFKKSLMFSEIDQEFIKEFSRYLKHKRGNSLGRQNKVLKVLKIYTSAAIQYKFISKENDPFKNWKFKNDKKLPVFLEEIELQRLIDLYKNDDVLTKSKRKVLRHYLFCCLGGGLRISDIRGITFDNLISNQYLVFSPVKIRNVAPKTIRIKLPKPAIRLIKDEGRYQGNIFNMFSDQVTNRHLKDIFEIAGIKRDKITFHSSRHTFAVTYLTKMKSAMAFPTLSKILGHATVQQTMDTYVGVTSLMLDEGMDNFNDFEL